jgi:signal transduction histidine kinase
MITRSGLTVAGLAGALVAIEVCFVAVHTLVALVLFRRAANQPVALLGALALLIFGAVTFPNTVKALVLAHPAVLLPVGLIGFIGRLAFTTFCYVFPDGRFVPRWTRWIVVGWAIMSLPSDFAPRSRLDLMTTPAVFVPMYLGLVGTIIGAQIYRYRGISSAGQRQQTKWVVAGFAGALGGFAALVTIGAATGLAQTPGAWGTLVVQLAFFGLLLFLPLTIGIAILRYRLFDIDVIINRALVYGGLSACVGGIYALLVGGLGAMLANRGNGVPALVAIVLIAIVAQPVREWLQRGVNQLMFGERDMPYAVISRLGQRLASSLAPDAVCSTIAETVAHALKLPYVAIELVAPDGAAIRIHDGAEDVAAVMERNAVVGSVERRPGAPLRWLIRLPLSYQGEVLGHMVLAPRVGETVLSPTDRQLLDDLARQAGIAVHAARLTIDLQRSRERLVTAQEEERRRLRRDLHDGLGPALAAQTLKVGTARALLDRDLPTARRLLDELENDIDAVLADIRRLVYALRPPVLDELGLLGALHDSAMQYGHRSSSALQVSLEAPAALPGLPAAIEVAVFRIAQEALANVVRHAQARHCHIRLTCNDELTLEISDDGQGIARARRPGVGQQSMRERAEELGGTCVIVSNPGSGTLVRASFPLPQSGP